VARSRTPTWTADSATSSVAVPEMVTGREVSVCLDVGAVIVATGAALSGWVAVPTLKVREGNGLTVRLPAAS
jgi:hypothetical protein